MSIDQLQNDYLGLAFKRERRPAHVRSKVGSGQRRLIYERDGFSCMRCGWQEKPELALGRKHQRERVKARHLTLHHRNGLPGDNRPENLETLCDLCHREEHK